MPRKKQTLISKQNMILFCAIDLFQRIIIAQDPTFFKFSLILSNNILTQSS